MTQDATKGIRKKKLISMEVCKAVLKYMDNNVKRSSRSVKYNCSM